MMDEDDHMWSYELSPVERVFLWLACLSPLIMAGAFVWLLVSVF